MTPLLRRTRSALHIASRASSLLIDTPPDLLFQLERESLSPNVEAVVITHHHLDHVLGLDDLSQVRNTDSGPLAVYAGARTQQVIRAAFPHLLREEAPRIDLRSWTAGTRLCVGDVDLEGFETHHREEAETTAVLLHGERDGRGIRVAYATDMGHAFPSPRDRLLDVDLFVGDGTYLGAAGYGHPGTARMLAIARALRARRTAVTHVGHWGISDQQARAALGSDVAICRDGADLLSYLS